MKPESAEKFFVSLTATPERNLDNEWAREGISMVRARDRAMRREGAIAELRRLIVDDQGEELPSWLNRLIDERIAKLRGKK